MTSSTKVFLAKSLTAFSVVFAMTACSVAPPVPHTPAPQISIGDEYKIVAPEPGPYEIVIVINDNSKMVHAGMFVGNKLLDPAGSYEAMRQHEQGWRGTDLKDYIRFQLEDGPIVRLYRFTLQPEKFTQIKVRVSEDTGTLPLFCAAAVQNIISGIEPFEAVPKIWMSSPAEMASHLDLLIENQKLAGACYWPNGVSCYPSSLGTLQKQAEK